MLSKWSELQVVTDEVVLEAVDMPCPIPLHFSHIADYVSDFCRVPDPDVGNSVLVEQTPFNFGLCGSKFVLCLFGDSPGIWNRLHS